MGNIQNGRNRPSKIRTLSAAFLLLSGATAFASDVATIADSPYQGKKLIISMQYDWEPLSFKDDSGNPTGYFYDIATEAAKRLGATVEITSGDFAAVIPAIQSGKFDTAVGLDATVARQEVVDVVSHVIAGYRLLVPAKSTTPDTQDLTAFCGLTIALLASHPAQGTFEETSKKCEAEGKKPITVSLYPDRAATFLAVKSVRADGTAGYTGENGWLLRKDPDSRLSVRSSIRPMPAFRLKRVLKALSSGRRRSTRSSPTEPTRKSSPSMALRMLPFRNPSSIRQNENPFSMNSELAKASGQPVIHRRHPARLVTAALALLLVVWFIDVLLRNPAFEWAIVIRYIFEPSIMRGLVTTPG